MQFCCIFGQRPTQLGDTERAEQDMNEAKKMDPGIETRFTN